MGVLLLCLLLPSVLVGVGLAVTCRPGWYTPPTVDYGRLHDDKAALAAWQDEISTALNTGTEIRVQLDQAQLNRWLAARAEFWPQAAAVADALAQPFVLLNAGEVQIAAVVGTRQLRGVLSVSGHATVNGDQLVLRCTGAHLGVLPLPASSVCNELRRRTPAGQHLVSGGSPTTLMFKNEFVWPNGKRRFRLRELSVNPGGLELVLEPLR